LLQNESIRQIIEVTFVEGIQLFDLCLFWWHFAALLPHVIRSDEPTEYNCERLTVVAKWG
jgi:hypothetical protein